MQLSLYRIRLQYTTSVFVFLLLPAYYLSLFIIRSVHSPFVTHPCSTRGYSVSACALQFRAGGTIVNMDRICINDLNGKGECLRKQKTGTIQDPSPIFLTKSVGIVRAIEIAVRSVKSHGRPRLCLPEAIIPGTDPRALDCKAVPYFFRWLIRVFYRLRIP